VWYQAVTSKPTERISLNVVSTLLCHCCKGEGTLCIYPRRKAYRGSGGIAPVILSLYTRWLISPPKEALCYWFEGLVGIRVGVDVLVKREVFPCRDSNLGFSSPWPGYLTTLWKLRDSILGRGKIFFCLPPIIYAASGDTPNLVLLTLILLTWRIGWVLNNASKWQMGFNSAFKGFKSVPVAIFPG